MSSSPLCIASFACCLCLLFPMGSGWGDDRPATICETDDAALDPDADGWLSESISAEVTAELRRLGAALVQPDAAHPERWSQVEVTLPAKSAERVLRQDAQLTVRRATADEGTATTTGLSSIGQWFPAGSATRAKFKLVGIQLGESVVSTQLRGELVSEGPHGTLELQADVSARWKWEPSRAPQLQSLRFDVIDVLSRKAGPIFQDQTLPMLSALANHPAQLQRGIDGWLQRLDKMLTDQFGHHGIAVADVNGDGRDDLYVCQPGGLPNLLLLQQEDGTVRAVSGSGLEILDLSRSALFVDFDNDGDQDLVLATASQVTFFRHDASLKFTLVDVHEIRDANSLSASDIDNDGDLDVYVCVYSGDGAVSRASPTPIPIHDARNGGANVLLRCESIGDRWQFTDVTDEVGLGAGNDRWSYAASWEDYDNDGDADLYVANDFGRNNLYQNESGHFAEVSQAAGLDESAFGMSVSWGDFDRDGLMDVYVSNMFSGAGNRVVPQPQFQQGGSDAVRKQLQYAARGNSLFRNLGDGRFADVSDEAGVTFGRWAWGSLFADIDNDGWEDLLVGNGFVTREDAPDL
ncbi:MAG: VCBS repeat-containing protein [Planctomycetota bacterium]